MTVERLSTSAFLFHDPGTRPGISQGPIDDPVLEQVVEKIEEPVGEALPAATVREPADTVQDLP